MKLYINKWGFLFICSFALGACTQPLSSKQVASLAFSSGACSSFETYFHDALQSSFETTGQLPETQSVLEDFEKESQKSLSEEEVTLLTSSLKNLYGLIENEIYKFEDSSKALKSLRKLEYQNHHDPELQSQYNKSLQDFMSLSQKSLASCTQPEGDNSNEAPVQEEGDFLKLLEESTNLAHFGGLKTFSVAYQSCEAVKLQALTEEDEDLDGVSIVGTHSSGIGKKREITSITKVLRTHPYLKNYRKPNSNCVDSTKKPLIYDFGGKPYATSDINSSLNIFKDAGSGSKELGIDCSGYIYSSLMSAGLKLSPDKPLRARGVFETPARHFQKMTGMSCFSKVKAGGRLPLRSGDIFASKGHIFMVNKIGIDPLGVEKALAQKDCDSINHEDFNFSLLQSSPSKGYVGLNNIEAADYFPTSKSMRIAMVKFAKLHCKSIRDQKIATPNISEATLIRHKMTSECISSKRIALERQSCVSSCSL